MNNDLHFTTGENDVETPDDFFQFTNTQAINSTGKGFGWDIAAVQGNRKCEHYFGPDHKHSPYRDCLVPNLIWPNEFPVWLNPPYGKPEQPCSIDSCAKKTCVKRGYHLTEYSPGCVDFVRRAKEQAVENGCDVWLLLAARTDTTWWHEYVWDADTLTYYPWVSHVEFIRGRIVFKERKDPAPFPSVMVRFKL